jgi:hypothetical protein
MKNETGKRAPNLQVGWEKSSGSHGQPADGLAGEGRADRATRLLVGVGLWAKEHSTDAIDKEDGDKTDRENHRNPTASTHNLVSPEARAQFFPATLIR